MTVVAVIPARAGSKGIPGKNLRHVGGRSLIGRSVITARACPLIDRVVVSTDGKLIADEARSYGAEVVERPAPLASDTATSESALVHALETTIGGPAPDDVLVFLQCTSPFIDATSLTSAVRRVRDGAEDVVFSAVGSHGFLWTRREGTMVGTNHSLETRLRRQDLEPQYLETGAFYVMRAAPFHTREHRFFGVIGVEEVSQLHAVEIDTLADLDLAGDFAQRDDPLGSASLSGHGVRGLVMDFDGVHTDNTALLSEDGIESATVNRSDGLGVARARRAGLAMLILSTETNPIVERRAEKLGVECISGCAEKLPALQHWARSVDLDGSEIAYLGNDVNDLACLEWVGWPVIVADAHRSLRRIHAAGTSLPGGAGAVREVIDALLADVDDHSKEPQFDRHPDR